jgi:hypothetical protein
MRMAFIRQVKVLRVDNEGLATCVRLFFVVIPEEPALSEVTALRL